MTISDKTKLSFVVIFIFFCSILIHAQSNLEDLNVVFRHNFENNTLGEYLLNEWKTDWLFPDWQTRLGETEIIIDKSETENPTKTLQINFPANSLGPNEGGVQWFTPIGNYDELYLSYDLYFMPGFNYQRGGKLPSFQGGSLDLERSNGYNGFTGGLMFKEKGEIAFYIYYPDSKDEDYGDTFPWGVSYTTNTPYSPSSATFEYGSGNMSYCTSGVWHNITYRIVLNSVKATGGGNYDGILEAYFDGKLVTQISHLLFRHTTDLKIDCLRIYSFFGGNTDDWRNPISEWLRIDNVIAFTYKDNIDVPRGNMLSPTNRQINYWRKFSVDYNAPPTAPSELTTQGVTKSSVKLRWNDLSDNEESFIIYRSNLRDGEYTQIGKVTANVNVFSDNGLSPATKYYYKIQASNPIGNSDFSNVLEITTTVLQIPLPPSSLRIASVAKNSINLVWNDDSSNENGFRIYRSNYSTEGFSEITAVAANNNSYIDNSLQPGTTYFYRIRAYNDDGLSDYTPVVSATTIALQIPSQPGNLITSHIEYTSSTLVWEDNSVNETGFELERCITDNCENTKTIIKLPANTKSYTDLNLSMNTSYQYRIRAINGDGNSGWSNMIVAVTPRIIAPVAPTKLKSTKFTDKSISVTWKDNSSNEDAFVITRSLAVNPSLTTSITLSANDTAFTDSSLVSSTTYFYTIKAINKGGQSSLSNKNVATTLSQAELKRIKNGLITYYNFGFNQDYIVYDQSGYGDPLNLHILNRSVINWNKDNTIDIINNTAVVSLEPATKIITAVKQTNEFTFECWLKPTEPFSGADSRIASISSTDDELGFALDQRFNRSESEHEFEYSVRLQTASTVTSGYPEYNSDLSQSYINLQHLVYTRDLFGKETFYLNGKKSSEGFRPSELDTWKSNYYLRLGNESDMNHSWTGSYYSVAIYNRALSVDEVNVNYSAGPSDSIQVADISYNLEVYPNPAPDEVNLLITPEVVTDLVPLTTIRILNVYGKVLYEESVFNPNRQIMKTINTRNFAPGIYLVQIVSGEKQKTARLIKP